MPCFPFQQHSRRDVQAHRDDSGWGTYEVTIKVKVKAEDYKAAKNCYLSVICGNQKEGRNWKLLSKYRQQVHILSPQTDPEIRVTKKEVR